LKLSDPDVAKTDTTNAELNPTHPGYTGPWGRFSDLGDTWNAAILFGDGRGSDWRTRADVETYVRANPQGGTLGSVDI
jgi:hypothetical protein